MPPPPPDTPILETVAGRVAAGGGGSDCVATRLVGAGCTVPVISAGREACDAKGLALGLPKRAVSELHPATPAARAPNSASRDHGRQIERTTTARIGLLTATQNTALQLNRRGVKIALSRKPKFNTNRVWSDCLQFARFSS